MEKKLIRLTEQDLHYLVENTIRAYLTENEMEEGFWGGLSTLGGRFGNKAAKAGQNAANSAQGMWNNTKNAMGQAAQNVANSAQGAWNKTKDTMGQAANTVGNAYNNAKNTVGNAYNNAANTVGNAYNNAKNTYQMGSANQDAQKAIQNALNALNALKAADQKMKQLGATGIGNGKQMNLINQTIQALSSGVQNIGSRFQAARDSAVNGRNFNG